MQELVNISSSMTLVNNASTTRKRQKKKGIAKDPALKVISKKIAHFVEVIGPGLKTVADCVVPNVKIVALMEASCRQVEEKKKEVEEKKKLLNEAILNIVSLSEDKALVLIQFLWKDENELEIFWDLRDDKKLYLNARLWTMDFFLTEMSG